MSASAKIEVVGVQETIKALRKIDPQLRRQFTKDAKQVAQPIIDTARRNYPVMPLSGMARQWTQGSRILFPWSQSKARTGVKFKVDTRRNATAVIKIQQTDTAASITEVAGKRNANPAGDAFNRLIVAAGGRVMWPAYEANKNNVDQAMVAIVRDAEKTVQRELR